MSVTQIKNTSGYLRDAPNKTTQDYMYVDDRIHKIYNIVVHTFQMSDVDDPEIYAAEPIWKWQQTEAGRWIMEKAIESPTWHQQVDYASFGYRFAIRAKLKDKDYTYWCLKYADTVDKSIL